MLEEGKIGRYKHLSGFDKGHIVMAGRLGQRIFKTAALAECSLSAVVDKWCREGTSGKRSLTYVVRKVKGLKGVRIDSGSQFLSYGAS